MSNSERAMQDAVERRDERDVDDLWPEADVVFDIVFDGVDEAEVEIPCNNCGAPRPFGYEAGLCFDCAACDECAKARRTRKTDGFWKLSAARRSLADALQIMQGREPFAPLSEIDTIAVQRKVTLALATIDTALSQMEGRRPLVSAGR